MSTSERFERSHDILIDAPPEAVFDYVANPKSWPEWLAASHAIDSPDRWLKGGETFHERWHTRKGEVALDWVVEESDRPRRWVVRTNTTFIGPIVTIYETRAEGSQTRYVRRVTNPARPKLPTPEMIQRMDEEAAVALANIKRNVEARHRNPAS